MSPLSRNTLINLLTLSTLEKRTLLDGESPSSISCYLLGGINQGKCHPWVSVQHHCDLQTGNNIPKGKANTCQFPTEKHMPLIFSSFSSGNENSLLQFLL